MGSGSVGPRLQDILRVLTLWFTYGRERKRRNDSDEDERIFRNTKSNGKNGYKENGRDSEGDDGLNTTFCARPEVHRALNEGFDIVSIDTWLVVIPQLIARIASLSFALCVKC